MATYGSYLDEDIDYDEGLSDSYLDLDEDFGESDDYDEARILRRDHRRGTVGVPTRRGRSFSSRQGMRAGSRSVNSSSVRNAFRDARQDIAVLDKRFKSVASKQSNEQLLEILSLLAFRPKPINVQLETPLNDKDKNPTITEITTGIENNLLPLILIKFLGNSGGKNTQQYLLIGLAALLLFPDTLKNLGLGGINSSSNTAGRSGTEAGAAKPIDTNLLLLGGLIYLATKDKR